MITRLKTSKIAKERLDGLNSVLRMSINAVILRYAIAKSIECEKNIYEDPDAEVLDNSGFEITRQTLFGENEILYKTLFGVSYTDTDDMFFPTLTNMHIERGLKILEREYKYAGNKDKFIKNIINKL